MNSIMMEAVAMSVLAAAAMVLAGCGETTADRALSGAGIGAAAGAVGGAMTGGSAASGAVLGGAAGAAAGGLTKSDDVNLGTPLWRR